MKRARLLLATVPVALGCATSEAPKPAVHHSAPTPPPVIKPTPTHAPRVEIFFRGEQPFARRGRPGECPGPNCEEWSLGEVTKREMVFSPDGQRFAYVRSKPVPATGKSPRGTAAPLARVLVRNLAGDPVNEFATFRPGLPDALSWLDNRRLSYLAPPDPVKPGKPPLPTYVLHDADTGEVLAARPGSDFVWDSQHRHVAFISGSGTKQALVVDGQNVWPRSGVTRLHGTPVWSNERHGLAFIDVGGAQPQLVVLVEYADPAGDLTWPIPREAVAPGLKIFWAGETHIVIGESALKPRFATGWERLQ